MDNNSLLLNLLLRLSEPCNIELTLESKEIFFQDLRQIYSDDNFRHSYAELSSFSEHDLNPESRDVIINNLDSILSYADENHKSDKDYDKIIKRIGKLADHLELESMRLNRFEAIKHLSSRTENQKKELENSIKKYKNDYSNTINALNEAKKQLKDINTQLISVLGIFSAVVIAFFGGLSYFTSVLSNLHNMKGYLPIVVISITGFVLFNTIICMFHFLCKMQEKKSIVKNWLVIFVNVMLIAIILLFMILKFTHINLF